MTPYMPGNCCHSNHASRQPCACYTLHSNPCNTALLFSFSLSRYKSPCFSVTWSNFPALSILISSSLGRVQTPPLTCLAQPIIVKLLTFKAPSQLIHSACAATLLHPMATSAGDHFSSSALALAHPHPFISVLAPGRSRAFTLLFYHASHNVSPAGVYAPRFYSIKIALTHPLSVLYLSLSRLNSHYELHVAGVTDHMLETTCKVPDLCSLAHV